MFGIGVPELLVLAIMGGLVVLLVVLPFWKIFTKAGFSGWLSLFMIVPLVGVFALFYLAFAEWPTQREINKLKNNLQ